MAVSPGSTAALSFSIPPFDGVDFRFDALFLFAAQVGPAGPAFSFCGRPLLQAACT